MAVMLATGCGVGEPRSIDPAGVDGLEIPTPSPDPADFVGVIDNPYLPFAPGSVWQYEVVEDGEVIETIEVRVTDDTREVAGVTTTVVHDVVRDASGAVIEDTFDWYAQDTGETSGTSARTPRRSRTARRPRRVPGRPASTARRPGW